MFIALNHKLSIMLQKCAAPATMTNFRRSAEEAIKNRRLFFALNYLRYRAENEYKRTGSLGKYSKICVLVQDDGAPTPVKLHAVVMLYQGAVDRVMLASERGFAETLYAGYTGVEWEDRESVDDDYSGTTIEEVELPW